MAAAKAGLSQVFTLEAHERVDATRPTASKRTSNTGRQGGLPFTIDRWGGRCQWRLTADAPITGDDGYASVNEEFCDARKAFYINRGIWDAIATSGPAISFAATQVDVDAYLDVSDEFLTAIS